MSRSLSTSKGGKKTKSAANACPPPPPPTLIRANTPADFETHVAQFKGCALVAVVSPLCSASNNTIVPYLEKLNGARPPLLKDANLVVVYAVDANRELCEQLQVSAVPCFLSYAYGELVYSFSGDNTAKVELVAKLAAQKAQEAAERLEGGNEGE